MQAGSRLGPYEVLAPLGAGGMAEVWRARDPRLGREVALKVLPTKLSGDVMALARFEREARAVAALSHPHIVAIHDFGSADGYAYAVTELLEGETLRARLAQGAVPPRRAAEWGAQVARALAAAHEKGIVHRDIKPDNLFVGRDGRIKVLDFGLALVDEAEWGARTAPGRVLGTVGYMAPEQVRGEAIDGRCDLFSLGCVLYEMVAGERPFLRASAAETLAAILLEEPPGLGGERSGGAVRIPPAFARIISHCLEKEPAERFQTARDLAFDLESLADATSGYPTLPPERLPVLAARAPAAQRPLRTPWTRLAVLAACVGLGLVIGRLLPAGDDRLPTRLRVLTHGGTDAWPSASPDSRLLAFASERDGRSRIWLRQMESGDEVALTAGVDSAPRFAPDGAAVLFVRRREQGSDLLRVATVGGEPRRVIPHAVAGDWSPDGSRIAFVRGRLRTRWSLGTAAADGSDEVVLSAGHPLPLAQPRWSPDGRYLAVLQRSSLAGTADGVLLVEVGSGEQRIVRSQRGAAFSALAWSGDGTLLLAAPEGAAARTPSSRLLAYRPGERSARTLMWVPYVVPSLELLGAGELVLTTTVPRQNLREVAVDDTAAGRWLSRGTTVDRQPVYNPTGDRIAFSSSRSGNLDLWSLATADGALRRLTDDPAEDWDPAFSRDGRLLLWSSNRGGHFEVWAAEVDGRAARQLSRDGEDAENPTTTPDGWVVYASGHREKRGLWRMRLDGSGAQRLRPGVTARPEVSPDGRLVLFDAPTADGQEVRVARLADGALLPFRIAVPFRNLPISGGLSSLPVALGRARWRPDGAAIAYVGLDAEGRVTLYEVPFAEGAGEVDSGARRVLASSEGELITESHGWAPDGSRLLVSFLERAPNLVVAEAVPGVAGPRRRR